MPPATIAHETGEVTAQSRWPRALRALRHRNYRLYFAGQTVSMAGTWMQNVAQGWLVLILTHSPFSLGVVTALQSLPTLLFALLGGVIADRFPKHRLLTVTQSAMAVLALVLALDVSAGTVRIWHIYILAILLGVCNAINMPTQQAFSVEMVGKEDLVNAIALNAGITNVARIAGPAIAGVLIAVAGIALSFYLNAASFLAVIVSLLLMRPSEFRTHGALKRGGSVRAQLREGLRHIRGSRPILLIMVLVLGFGMFGWTQNVLFPVFAKNVLHIGSVGYGAMTSAFGVGSLLAVMALTFAREARRSLMFLGMAGVVVLSLAFAWSRSYPLTLLLLAGMGGATFCFSTQTNTIIQTLAPDALRGRIMSLYMMLFVGSQPLGSFVNGSLASAFGAPVAQTVDAVILAAVLAAVLIFNRWQRPSPAASPEEQRIALGR